MIVICRLFLKPKVAVACWNRYVQVLPMEGWYLKCRNNMKGGGGGGEKMCKISINNVMAHIDVYDIFL